MKRILIATTSLFAASAAIAHAQEAEHDDNMHMDAEVQTEAEAEATQTWDEADLDRLPYTDDHDLIEATVYGQDGEELGEVERVRLSADGEVEAVVVEHGGVLEIGGEERLIEAGDFMIDESGDTTSLQVSYDVDSFAALPAFSEDFASDYPLSSSDQIEDLGDDAEAEIDGTMSDWEDESEDEVAALESDADEIETDVETDLAQIDRGYDDDTMEPGDDEYVGDRYEFAETETEDDTMWSAAENDTPWTDDHELIDEDVYGSDGVELGEVERVRISATGEVDAIVVEYGDILEVGGREIMVEASDYSVERGDDDARVTVSYDQAAFEALPDFNEREASDYPLSDDDIGDDNADEEGEPDMELEDGSK